MNKICLYELHNLQFHMARCVALVERLNRMSYSELLNARLVLQVIPHHITDHNQV